MSMPRTETTDLYYHHTANKRLFCLAARGAECRLLRVVLDADTSHFTLAIIRKNSHSGWIPL